MQLLWLSLVVMRCQPLRRALYASTKRYTGKAFMNKIRAISFTQIYTYKYCRSCTTKIMKAWVNKH
ncbi:hypothetical protein EW104_03760 [Vibrio cholerae]|nr:hypothetical protein [Vibrio cholerae]EGR0806766.1 hypothetical protein [Vibrio cholerae]EGR0811478.1 hypothetical protein [Vibrio cholerae]EGR0872440.1 hypothetical protein [Vibrio cholerae]